MIITPFSLAIEVLVLWFFRSLHVGAVWIFCVFVGIRHVFTCGFPSRNKAQSCSADDGLEFMNCIDTSCTHAECNCVETQYVDACREFAATCSNLFLSCSPERAIVATSRESLDLALESLVGQAPVVEPPVVPAALAPTRAGAPAPAAAEQPSGAVGATFDSCCFFREERRAGTFIDGIGGSVCGGNSVGATIDLIASRPDWHSISRVHGLTSSHSSL